MSCSLRRSTGLGLMLLICGGFGVADAQAQKTVLRLRLDGPLMERPSEAAGLMALLEEKSLVTLHDLVGQIREAARDRKIDGLVLIMETPELYFAQAEELVAAIQYFRSKDKPAYCYLDYADNLPYAVAAATDHITLAENSLLEISGLAAQLMYYKGLLDKVGIEADILHCGAYKSAGEPFTRSEPSAEAAENINWLLDGLYNRWVEMIAAGRKLDTAEVKRLIDLAPLHAEEALAARLVDEVSSFPAFKQKIQKEFGSDVKVLKEYKESAGLEIDMENPFAVFQLFSKLMEGPPVADEPGIGLIYIDGAIMVGESDDSPFGGGASAGSTTVRAAFEEAREDEKIKAVVVRVNSPGGSALASDIIWKAATQCAQEKPVIVTMGGVAGSGGYYVAIPGDTIFADATTITGSIGVVGGKMIWRELLEEKLGITTTMFNRGQHAGMWTITRGWDESERAWVQEFMDETYEQFKGRVLASRGQRLKGELEEMAGGRVFTGQQALERGLIDQIGGLTDALDAAAKKVGLGPDYEIYQLPKPDEFAAFLDFMQSLMGQKEQEDEYELNPQAQLGRDPLLRAVLPLLGRMAPREVRSAVDALWQLTVLQREQVGCFMTLVPDIR